MTRLALARMMFGGFAGEHRTHLGADDRALGLAEEAVVLQDVEELGDFLGVDLAARHAEARLDVAIGRMLAVAERAVAEMGRVQIVLDHRDRLFGLLVEQREMAQVGEQAEIRIARRDGVGDVDRVGEMADQVHLVDVAVENLEREVHRPFFLAVFKDLVDRIDQQLLGFLALGVARILAGDDAHHLGAEVVGLVDAVLHRADGAAALVGVEGIEVELVAEDARLGGIGDRQMRLVEQRAAGVAHPVILHPADFDGGPEIVGANFFQRFGQRPFAGLKAREGLEVHHALPASSGTC